MKKNLINNRYHLLMMMAVLLSSIGYSQGAGQSTTDVVDLFPLAPESAKFATYGDIPINLSSGQVSYQIPIHEFRINDFTWPVALNYSYNGLKLEEKQSTTGLGWLLTGAGVVSREVRGLPDEHPEGGYYGSNVLQQTLQPLFDNDTITYAEASEIMGNKIDGEADVYHVSTNGINVSFKVGLNGEAVLLSQDNYKINLSFVANSGQAEIDTIEVIDMNGIKYEFTEKETNFPLEGASYKLDNFDSYTSAWYLSKITALNGEYIDFLYVIDTYTDVSFYAIGQKNDAVVQGDFQSTAEHSYTDGFTKTQITRKIPIAISGPSSTVQLFLNADKTYSNIKVKNTQNEEIWDYDLTYDTTSRHLLTSIDRNDEHYYTFEYHSSNLMPDYITQSTQNVFGQDYWGFANGATNQYGVTVPASPYQADRLPNFTYTRMGALKKIVFPTKGYNEIEYEQNRVKRLRSAPTLAGNPDPNFEVNMTLQSDYYLNNYTVDNTDPTSKSKLFVLNLSEDTYVTTMSHSFQSDQYSWSSLFFNKQGDVAGCPSAPGDYHESLDLLENIQETETPLICPSLNIVVEDGQIGTGSTVNLGGSGSTFYMKAGAYNLLMNTDRNRTKYVNMNFNVKFNAPVDDYYNIQLPASNDTHYNDKVGGIRVKLIKSFDHDHTELRSRFFDYNDDEFLSTGIELQNPYIGIQYVVRHAASTIVADINRLEYNFRTLNSVNLNQGVPVFYKKVREYEERNVTYYDFEANANPLFDPEVFTYIGPPVLIDVDYPNGYTMHEFFDPQVNLQSAYPFIPVGTQKGLGSSGADWVYDDNDTLKSSVQNDYWNTRKVTSGGQDADSNHPQNVKLGYLIKPEGAFHNWSVLDAFQHFTFSEYKEVDKDLLPIEKIQKEYLPEEVTVTETYSYDDHIQLEKKEVTDSNANTITDEFYYPYTPSTVNSAMVATNQIGRPLKTETSITDDANVTSMLSTSTTTYADFHGMLLPSMASVAKGNNTLEEVVTYHDYYTHGKLKEFSQNGGAHTVVIWGYDSQFPVAKVENATYAQVAATGIVQSVLDDPTDDAELRDEVQKIRSGLPDAMVTTYTYQPQVGVTSVTDPREYTTFYVYDTFNRLKYVKDEAGHVVSENEYNYAQPQN